jgi:hypothetical protein
MTKRTHREYEGGLLKSETVEELEQLGRALVVKEALAAEPAADAGLLVLKEVEEHRVTIGVAYPAMKPDSGVAKDGHIDFISEAALEVTAWSWMKERRDIGLLHADGFEGHGTVVESSIYRGPDWTMKASDGSEQTIRQGDWLLSVQWSPEAWSLIKSGRLTGYSPQGRASRTTPSADRLAELRS